MPPNGRPTTTGPVGEDAPTERFVAWTLERFGHLNVVLTTSFGMEGCVLIDLYASLGRPLTVYYLDTGFFFPETYELRDRMVERYPTISFVDRGTDLSPALQADLFGAELWHSDPDLCCHLRKVAPMQQVLAGVDVWITAVTRHQSPARATLSLIEWDWQFQLLKVSPLAGWDRARVWDYVRSRDVPYNPLHLRGYASIGCTHCTRSIAGLGPDQYSRAGRWSGSDKTECGLHLPVLASGA
jgi:phosphoadenosine phosphosulfate reductase